MIGILGWEYNSGSRVHSAVVQSRSSIDLYVMLIEYKWYICLHELHPVRVGKLQLGLSRLQSTQLVKKSATFFQFKITHSKWRKIGQDWISFVSNKNNIAWWPVSFTNTFMSTFQIVQIGPLKAQVNPCMWIDHNSRNCTNYYFCSNSSTSVSTCAIRLHFLSCENIVPIAN